MRIVARLTGNRERVLDESDVATKDASGQPLVVMVKDHPILTKLHPKRPLGEHEPDEYQRKP